MYGPQSRSSNLGKRGRSQSTLPYKNVKRTRYASKSRIPRSISITGAVPANRTTLARAPGPFQAKKFVTFEYQNELSLMGGATNLTAISVAPNSLFDFDKNGMFGNKQPMFYDTLLTASGPYRQYKVISWVTTYTISNVTANVPLTIWAIPPVLGPSEIDSAAEADNWPGVERLYLTGGGGSKAQGTITVTGHVKDCVASYSNDAGLVGAYNGDPTNIIYQGLVVKGADGTTAPSVYIAVRHMAYAELTQVDSIVS